MGIVFGENPYCNVGKKLAFIKACLSLGIFQGFYYILSVQRVEDERQNFNLCASIAANEARYLYFARLVSGTDKGFMHSRDFRHDKRFNL